MPMDSFIRPMLRNVYKSPNRSGFTLLETVVAISLIVLLAGVLLPLVKSSLLDAKVSKILATIETVKKAATKYYYDTGRLPQEDATASPPVHDLFANTSGVSNWKGPYISAPLDSNSNPYGDNFILGAMLEDLDGLGHSYVVGGSSMAAGPAQGCQVVVYNLPQEAAFAVNRAFDGDDGANNDLGWIMDVSGSCILRPNHPVFTTIPAPPGGAPAIQLSESQETDAHVFLFQK